MDILKNLGLEHWWNILIYLGVALIASTLVFEINFIEKRHLFGLGLGLFTTGLSHNIAFKQITIPEERGYWSGNKMVHTWYSKLLFLLGISITGYFLFLIIKTIAV
jgi:hypothetical protein